MHPKEMYPKEMNMMAQQPKEFPNVRDYISTIEDQQENIKNMAESVLNKLIGAEPIEGAKVNDESCLARLEEIAKVNETIFAKLKKISECI